MAAVTIIRATISRAKLDGDIMELVRRGMPVAAARNVCTTRSLLALGLKLRRTSLFGSSPPELQPPYTITECQMTNSIVVCQDIVAEASDGPR